MILIHNCGTGVSPCARPVSQAMHTSLDETVLYEEIRPLSADGRIGVYAWIAVIPI